MGSVNRPERLAAGIAAHVCDVSYGLPALNKSDETAAPPPPYPDGRFLRRCTLALITIPSHADHGASVADPVAREVPALGRGPRKRVPTWRPSSPRSEEHTSELQSLMRISYAVFCLKKK